MRRKASFTSLGLGLAAIFFAFGSPLAMADSGDASDCDVLLKASVSDPHQISGITGSAILCIDHSHATVSEWAENLRPGHAYTTWFAYIDDPAQCGQYPGGIPGVCADADGVLPAAEITSRPAPTPVRASRSMYSRCASRISDAVIRRSADGRWSSGRAGSS